MSHPALARGATCSFYASGVVALLCAIRVGAISERPPVHPLDRGLWRGQISPGLPRLDPDDPMANAAVLGALLDDVGHPGLGGGRLPCAARGRSFALIHRQRLSRVRFGGRAVCQLQLLKRTSSAQPGGMGEVAALILGRRLAGGSDVDVTRIVVPPFRFGRDTLELIPADLGPLRPGEQFIGTYHTHPDGDIEQGVLSEQDLAFMESGRANFHGRVGALSDDGPDIDWIFDIVDPQGGDWNVYAHDRPRLSALHARCQKGPTCPLDELRLAGSPHYLLVRHYEERDQDF